MFLIFPRLCNVLCSCSEVKHFCSVTHNCLATGLVFSHSTCTFYVTMRKKVVEMFAVQSDKYSKKLDEEFSAINIHNSCNTWIIICAVACKPFPDTSL